MKRKDRIARIKAEIVETKEKVLHWQNRFDNAPNLHERDCAFVLLNCYNNKVSSLYEELETALI